jgi:hypothetical protein
MISFFDSFARQFTILHLQLLVNKLTYAQACVIMNPARSFLWMKGCEGFHIKNNALGFQRCCRFINQHENGIFQDFHSILLLHVTLSLSNPYPGATIFRYPFGNAGEDFSS